MKAQSTKSAVMLLAIPVLFVGLLMLNGCKDSGSGSSADSGQQMQGMQGHEGHDHAQMAMNTETTEEVAAEVEQKTCPVMEGNPINKAYFTEYKGKKVYFCCPGCDEKFKANPEKYIAKLPQFQQQAQ